VDILRRALDVPIRIIADNSGAEGAVVLDNVGSKKGNYGYDALAEKYGDMIEFGIIDPAKVTRAAVENAISVASMILTTESLITDKKEDAVSMPSMPPGGGGGMDF